MTVEHDSVEIEYLTLLKFTAAPDRRKRRQMIFIGAIFRAQADDDRPVLFLHRVKVIDRFRDSRAVWLSSLPRLPSPRHPRLLFTLTFSVKSASGQSIPVAFEQ